MTGTPLVSRDVAQHLVDMVAAPGVGGAPAHTARGSSAHTPQGIGASPRRLALMPEAYEHGGPTVGLMTTLGFGLAFALTQLE